MTPSTPPSNTNPEPLTGHSNGYLGQLPVAQGSALDATQISAPQSTSIEIPISRQITRLGAYRLVRELGSGGMGVVYEAIEDHTDRTVAIKVLRSNLPDAQAGRERFVREARSMASLSNDHIVPVYAVGEEQGVPYMVMPLLVGETLETRLDRAPQLSTAEIARIGKEIATGLAAAHAAELIHRDIKPSNVWIEAPTQRVKLLDFGLALASNSANLTVSGFVIGTPSYMSPEQSRGESLDGRSDLFSLGVILYQAATGRKAFDGPNPGTVMRNLELHYPPRVDLVNPEMPPHLADLIMTLMSKDRRQRPASAEAVAERLGALQLGRSTRVPIAPLPVTPLPNTIPANIPPQIVPNAKTVQAEVYRSSQMQPVSAPLPTTNTSEPAPHKSSPKIPVTTTAVTRPQPQDSTLNPVSYPSPVNSQPYSSMDDTPKPSSTRLIVLTVVALVAFGIFFWTYTDKGEVLVQADDPNVIVEFSQQGVLKEMAEIGKGITLKSGEYEVALRKGTTGLKLSADKVNVTRGGKETLRVNKVQ